jgi:hypothetical protein
VVMSGYQYSSEQYPQSDSNIPVADRRQFDEVSEDYDRRTRAAEALADTVDQVVDRGRRQARDLMGAENWVALRRMPPGDALSDDTPTVPIRRMRSEATGSLVQAASASPITMARIQLEPEHVVVRNRRRGRFRVTVDNSRGALPLSVWLSGTDPEGAVRFAFTPPRLDVPPGNNGRAALRVWASLPGSGKEVVREINVKADDGVGAVEAEGRFTQSMSEILPLLRRVFTLVGGLLVVLGALRPWFLGGPTYDIGRLLELQNLVYFTALGELENIQKLEMITQPAARALMLVFAGVMMLGILSASGRFTVVAGFLAAMLMVGYVAYGMSEFHSDGPAYGALLVVLGAIIGIVGGFCIKRGGAT